MMPASAKGTARTCGLTLSKHLGVLEPRQQLVISIADRRLLLRLIQSSQFLAPGSSQRLPGERRVQVDEVGPFVSAVRRHMDASMSRSGWQTSTYKYSMIDR
jgi:hypothetical protein